mgnify:CR=1 FL=1
MLALGRVFLRLSSRTRIDALSHILKSYFKGTIERVKKIRDYAFIHFNTRDNALKAMKEMDGSTIDNAVIEVFMIKK